MSNPVRSPSAMAVRRFAWLALGLALVAAGLLLALRLGRPAAVVAVHLQADASTAWSGLSENEQAGLLTLLQQAVELDPRITLLQERPPAAARQGHQTWILAAGREGDRLRLRLQAPGGRASQHPGAPLEAVGSALAAMGIRARGLDRLLPADPSAFWNLADLCGPYTFDQLKRRKLQAFALAERHPGCAGIQYQAAYISLRLLIVEAESNLDAVDACDRHFLRSLRALPEFPRALYQYCRFKADLGDGREALEQALRLRDLFPNHPLSYGALAYAARNAGLLEAARNALEARASLLGDLVADPGLGENTYLYLGDLDRFERSLATAPGTPASPIRLFYRGYAQLLRGDRARALELFRACRAEPGRVIQFEALAEVYELALQDQSGPALARLRALRTTRTQLRVPDGEFTFKLAEAFGFLGAYPEALETASSAFAQGFGCTRWYRQSPFLQPLQVAPRWQSLLNLMQERESLMATRFPAQRFRRR